MAGMNSDLVTQIVAELTAKPEFADIQFVTAFENEIKPTPVLKPICAISVQGSEIGEKITNALPTGEIVETNSRFMDTKISLDFYLPYSLGGNEGHKLFDKVSMALLFNPNYKVLGAKCFDARHDKLCQSLVVHSHILIRSKISL